jgi:GTPase SAR1 family protein
MQQRRLSIEQLCNKLKPVFGKRIDDIYLKYAMAESNEEREEIAHILNALYHKNLGELLDNKVLLEPPKVELDGEYPLGKISYAGKDIFNFNLREQDWPRHVCISGMSGSGKTTLAINLVNNFIKQDKPFLVFDWKKSFRPLLLADSEVVCFSVGNENVSNLFKLNINQPPKGINPKEWINVLCDLLVESFSASFGVHKVLLETLDAAFKQWGVYEGSENYPTWENIKWYLEEKLEKTNGREAGWLESALRIASILTFGNFGSICNSKDEGNLSIEDILNKKVILELNVLSNIEKKFFCEFLLTYIYKLKKANQKDVSGKFDHAIVVDEAHNIFLKSATHFVKESVTDMVYREMREYGTALVCLDQHVSKLSDTVKGNSACHIAFQQQLPQDIFDIAGIMQLQEQRQFFSKLAVGSAIVKLSERYTSPFLIEVPNSELREYNVSDEKVKSRAKAVMFGVGFEKSDDEEFNKELVVPEVKVDVHYDRVDVKDIGEAEPVVEFEGAERVIYDFVNKKLDEGMSLIEIENFLEKNSEGRYSSESVMKVVNYILKNQLNVENVIPESEQQKQNIYNKFEVDSGNLQEMFLAFLRENHNQNYGTVDIYKQLGLSSRKGNKIKNELLEKNLIAVEEVRNDKGWKKIIRPVNPIHIH